MRYFPMMVDEERDHVLHGVNCECVPELQRDFPPTVIVVHQEMGKQNEKVQSAAVLRLTGST